MNRPPTEADDDAFDAVIGAFLERRRLGENPSIDEFAARVPEREREVRRILKALLALEPFGPDAAGPQLVGPHLGGAHVREAGGPFARDLHGSAVPPPPTERVGPYLLLRELGRGGMGVVYEARHKSLERRVALKLLRPGLLDSPDALQRFRREAELASKLDHPGICTVYETGFERGSPFIAMRFVEGETLADKIARRLEEIGPLTSTVIRLDDVRAGVERVSRDLPTSRSRQEIALVARLVENVARALHAAHEAGIVHRDVKPGNVLVTRDGSPVVVDFGLARDVEGGATLTLTGDLCGTPSYLPPEHLSGAALRPDRQSDVYSLGVTLYECLTLHRPFEAPTREALYHAILTREPADPRSFNPAIPADLAAILSTALERDRRRRYQSATDFADDLARFVELRPVAARPIGPLRRIARAARRRPAAASAAALAFLIVVGVPLGYAVQQSIARTALAKERDRADANYREARAAVEEMLTRVADEHLEESPDLQDLRRQILDSALAFYRRFVEVNQGDPLVRRETADAYRKIGSLLDDLGHATEARAPLEHAIGLLDRLIEEEQVSRARLGEQPDGSTRLAVMDALAQRGDQVAEKNGGTVGSHGGQRASGRAPNFLRMRADCRYVLASVCRQLGLPAEREENLRLGIADLERALVGASERASHAAAAETLVDLARSHTDFANLFNDSGRANEAEASHRRALDLLAQIEPPLAHDARVRDLRSTISVNLGTLCADVGRLAEAEAYLVAGRTELAAVVAEAPSASEHALLLARADQALADLWQSTGRAAEAEAAYLEAIAALEPVAARRPGRPHYRGGVGDLLGNLASLLDQVGRREESEAAYRRELEIRRELAREFSDIEAFTMEVGRCLSNLGWEISTRSPAEAEQNYRQALEIQTALAERQPANTDYAGALANMWDLLGSLLYETKRLEEAEQAQQHALSLRSDLAERFPEVPAYASDLGGLLMNLARTVRDRGDPRRALELVDESICWQERALAKNPDHPTYRWFLRLDHSVRAETCLRLALHSQAAESARRLPEIFPKRDREWREAAKFLARCAPLAAEDPALDADVREELARGYADEAVACLRAAAERGYRDVDEVARITAFDPLREREDFTRVVESMREGASLR